jgi:hypothetical protein
MEAAALHGGARLSARCRPLQGSTVAQGVTALRGWTAAVGSGPQGHGVQPIA